MKGTIRQDLILRHWDDLLRLAGSLKRGWVTASLFISKLQAYPRQTVLTRALQKYGRLIKTLFILRYLANVDDRRRINAQLNKGESLHALRDFLFVADTGVIRRKQEEAQISPAWFEHINPYGKYDFPLDEASRRQGLRPLRAA